MHDIHPFVIPSEMIGIDLAECIGIQALVEIADGGMYFLLLGGDTPLVIKAHGIGYGDKAND